MAMTSEETLVDHCQGLAFRLVEMIIAIEMKVLGKADVQVLCMRSMSRLFYKFSSKSFYFPDPNLQMLTAKVMQLSPFSRASASSHCFALSGTAHAFTPTSIWPLYC